MNWEPGSFGSESRSQSVQYHSISRSGARSRSPSRDPASGLKGDWDPQFNTKAIEEALRRAGPGARSAGTVDEEIDEYGEPPRADERDIIGTDGRDEIKDVSRRPFRWICYLSIKTANGAGRRGTGFLIGPRTVVTAAHCVWDKKAGNGYSRSITVFPAGGPGLQSRETDLHTVKEWSQGGSNPGAQFDFGAITLEKPLGEQVGWFGFADWSESILLGNKVNVAGYPGDKPNRSMWGHADAIKRVLPQVMEYYVDTKPGQSGSPVYVQNGEKFTVVGVHNNGAVTSNLATRINAGVFNLLKEWKNL